MLFPLEEYWKEKTSVFLQNKYWISVALFKENIYLSIPVIYLRVMGRGLLWSSTPCKNISYKLPVNKLTFPKLYLWRMHMTHSRTKMKWNSVKCFTKKISAELFFHDVSLLILIVFHIKIVKKWNAAFMIIISGRLI